MRSLFLLPLIACFAPVLAAGQETLPRLPCDPGDTPLPAYAEADAPPAVRIWHDIELIGDPNCLGRLQGHVNLVVALSGRFRYAGTLNDLAARVGAISETVGLRYWTSEDQTWRSLISEATALTGRDGDWNDGELTRRDFTAAQVRSGEALWFRQNDTRSIGANLYRLRTLQSEPGRLIVEIVNESPITYAFVTVFGAHELLTLHVVERLGDDLWGYYGLAAVRNDAMDDHEKSLVNRAAAFCRFLQGKPGDAAPPLGR